MPYNKNPYTPGAGKIPSFLAGREQELDDIRDALDGLTDGDICRSMVFYGLRGVGKTVLLNAIEGMCETRYDIQHHFFEASESGDFASKITTSMLRVLMKLSILENVKDKIKYAGSVLHSFHVKWAPKEQAFEFGFGDVHSGHGVSDTGNLYNDLVELFLAVGAAAKSGSQAICLLIDEMQYLKKVELEALIGALHRCSQKDIPICVFGAGLPKIAKDAGNGKSYAERLFQFRPVGSLKRDDATAALEEPAKLLDVNYAKDAVEHILHITDGYPYFIQEYGRQIWRSTSICEGYTISLADAVAAEPVFWESLDESFFKVRFDRATPSEQRFMFAMAQSGNTPCTIAEVAELLDKPSTSIGPTRAQLISKGLIYSTRHGQIDYTVPQFSRYLRRFHPEYFV